MKHTPGPWIVSKLPEQYDHDCINANGPIMVAKVIRKHMRPDELAANANLIAAAPDLLALLRQTANYILSAHDEAESDGDIAVAQHSRKLLDNIWEAIKKAEGG
jgi:hypothetical protein